MAEYPQQPAAQGRPIATDVTDAGVAATASTNAIDAGASSSSSSSADEVQPGGQGHTAHADSLPRQFSTLSILALSFSITNSWIGYSAVFVTPLLAGGGPGVIYCLLVASLACSLITAGLAELASAFPSAGGQYHFVYMVSSGRSRPVIAFATGWLSVFAWLFTTASACIFCAQICVNLAVLFHADYVPTQWQVYLIYVAIVAACTLITIFLPKLIPMAETIFFVASVLGFVVFPIAMLAVSETKQPARTVFVDWVNLTGWDDGTAFLLGVGQAMYTFLAVDSASHISEEVPDPGRKVPQTMLMTVLIGIVTVIPWTLAFMFTIQDFDSVSVSSLPIMEVYYQALRDSRAGAAFLSTWLLFVYFGACLACTVTTGRLIWALARDHGMVFSTTFEKVHKDLQVPVNATIFTGVFCALYGLIYVGSTTAFNSFIATAILFLNVTYAIPQAVVLFRGRQATLPTRYLDLGSYFGPFCNLFSVLWVLLFTVIFCFPTYLPVTVAGMNYVSVIIAGAFLFIGLLWWTSKRHTFTGPQVILNGAEPLQALQTQESQLQKVTETLK